MGYERERALGKWFGEFLADESAATFESQFPEFLANGKVQKLQLKMQRSDGKLFPVTFDGQVEYDENGDVLRTHCQFTDLRPIRERDQEIQRLSEFRRVASEVDRILVRTEDRREMLERVTSAIAASERFGCTFAVLTDLPEVEFVCGAGSSLDSQQVREFHTAEYLETVIETGTYEMEDVTEPPFDQHPEGHQTHGGIGLTIGHNGNHYGVLTVHLPPGADPTGKEKELLKQLATDLGVFVRNQHLEQERQAKAERLETRERLFSRLYQISRDGLSAESESDLYERVVSGMVEALGYQQVACFGFDAEEGVLRTRATSSSFATPSGDSMRISPDDEPIWGVFREEETRMFEGEYLHADLDERLGPATQLVAVPVGDYGLLLMKLVDETVDGVDIEMMELCASHTEALLGRIRRETALSEASGEVSKRAERNRRLRSFIEATDRIETAIADRETPEGMNLAACEELVSTDTVDFAWIGRPRSFDTDLERSAAAGTGGRYLDALDLRADEFLTLAQEAAESREMVEVPWISDHLHEGMWAKEALSMGYSSALAVPIEDESGVLYGVLAVYSQMAEGFDEPYPSVLSTVTSLLSAYNRVHRVRATQTEGATLEIEFEVHDPRFRLLAVASRVGSPLSFETVLGVREDAVRVLVTSHGDDETVPEQAREDAAVRDAEWLGAGTSQLLLTVESPCLMSEAPKHGAQVIKVDAKPDRAVVTLSYPTTSSVRPLFERLQSLYDDVELRARRETTTSWEAAGDAMSALTERQQEILKAAYYGGYFDNPRAISGENLAIHFEISNSAVSKHLRAATRGLLEQLLVSADDNEGFSHQL
jgi:predicted DNA binding protein/GAF domain-containing protein